MKKFITPSLDGTLETTKEGIVITVSEDYGFEYQPEIFVKYTDLPAVITWMQKALEEKLAEKE